jgi:hypothetical protein
MASQDSTDLVAFDRKSAARIARAVKRIEATPHNGRGRGRKTPGWSGRDRWFGVTATCPEFPDYPQPPPATADTYCVRLIERFFREEPGNQTQTELRDNRYVVARLAAPTKVPDEDKRWLPEGTEVEVYRIPTRRGPRYYCRPLAEQERLFVLASSLKCGNQANAYLLLGPGPDQVYGGTFQVRDDANLVGTLGLAVAPAGTRGIAKWFCDRPGWVIVSLGACIENVGGCDYTGTVQVGKGDLHRSGDNVCETLLTLTFERGLLCSMTETGEACVYVCCDSSSSSSDPPSDSSSDSSDSSDPPPPSESSSETTCEGQCVWQAVEEPESESSDSSDSSSSSVECIQSECDAAHSMWTAVAGPFGLEWSRTVDCPEGSPCKAYYPELQPSYPGETVVSECGCGCGRCAYQYDASGTVHWQQRAGCADWANCTCPEPPGPGIGAPDGYLLVYECEE